MDASNPMTPQNQQKREDSRRKRKAVLAGGVVLGLGAAVTLAAWSDDVFASGTFTSGQFNIQANETADLAAAANWKDYNKANEAAPLTFTTGVAAMVPGTTVYSPISLRIDPAKNANSANVRIVSAASTGDPNLVGKLVYEARSVASPSACAAGSGFTGGNSLIPAATAVVSSTPTATTFALEKDATVPVTVCIAVTLPNQPAGTPSNAADWTFAAPAITTWKLTGESF